MSMNGDIDADLIRIDKPRTGPGRSAVSPAPTLKTQSATEAEGDEMEPGAEPGERQRVVAALEQAGWVQARAARLLGMTPRQIAYRIQTLNIEVRQI